jgi:GT2 family glycosyltransferase
MVTIVIPTFERSDLLEQCLNRIKPEVQTTSISYDVIVTDDSRDDRTKKMCSEYFPWVLYTEGPKRGPAANRNYGASKVSTKWIIFFDDDCLPNVNILENYVLAMSIHDSIDVFEGRIFADRLQQGYDEISPVNETGGYLWSCNFAIRRKAYNNLGGFDEGFPYAAMEDVDLHYRIKKANLIIFFLIDAGVCHPWRKKAKKDFDKNYESYKYFIAKYPEIAKNRSIVLYLLSRLKYLVKMSVITIFRYRGRGIIYLYYELRYDFIRTALIFKTKYFISQ